MRRSKIYERKYLIYLDIPRFEQLANNSAEKRGVEDRKKFINLLNSNLYKYRLIKVHTKNWKQRVHNVNHSNTGTFLSKFFCNEFRHQSEEMR